MYKVLTDDEIPDNAGIAIEYNLPQTAKRVDFIISGYDEKQNSHAIIIELKQWESVEAIRWMDNIVRTYVAGAKRNVVHPSYQAWSYASIIQDYNRNVQMGDIALHPCAYLHNYHKVAPEVLESEQYQDVVESAPLFFRGDVPKLREFIKKYVKSGDDKKLLYEIDTGRIKPSKSLQNSIKSMLDGNQEFVMLDEQKVAYEQIQTTALKCAKDHKKCTNIVKGGPGTGKTVIAMNLLARLTNQELFVQYVTKNGTSRHVYEKKLTGHKKNRIHAMFRSSGQYTDAQENIVDVVLCDEAHRLTEKTQNGPVCKGENQIKELIKGSLCNVFFIDESQRVTLADIGSINQIRNWAEKLGSQVSVLE